MTPKKGLNPELREAIMSEFADASQGIYSGVEECLEHSEEHLLATLDEVFFMIAHRDFRQNQDAAIRLTESFLRDGPEHVPSLEEIADLADGITKLRQKARF